MPRRSQPARKRKSPRGAQRVDPLARERALEALSHMRRGLSLRKAAKETHTTAETVRRYVPRALDRMSSGRYAAKAIDSYERTLYMLTERGKVAVTVRGSRAASKIANYWVAVDEFLRTGRTDRLRAFRGESVRAGKEKYAFITNVNMLRRLGYAGEVSFETLYLNRG